MANTTRSLIHVETGQDTFDLRGYTCELSATSFVPPTRRTQPKERNFFNSHQEVFNYLIIREKEHFLLFLDKTIVDLRANI